MTEATRGPATIPAATLILFRARAGGDPARLPPELLMPGLLMPELLMIERGAGMAFAAGALVFPGGRVDPGDEALAADLVTDGESASVTAACVAAIRETIEEAGIAVGLVPAPGAGNVARLRADLAAGGDFAALLDGAGLLIDPAALTPFARWRPNMHETRNFDTVFFIAEAPAGAIAVADGGESVRAVWATARSLLDDADAGLHRMVFPTRRNLERLALLSSIGAAIDHAAAFPIDPITPWIEERDGARWLCIPDGRGYPVTAELLSTAKRG